MKKYYCCVLFLWVLGKQMFIYKIINAKGTFYSYFLINCINVPKKVEENVRRNLKFSIKREI